MNKRVWIWIGGVVALLIVAAGAAYVLYADTVRETVREAVATYLRNRVSEAAHEASAGKVQVTFQDFDYGFFTQNVSINGIRVSVHDEDSLVRQSVELTIDELSCSGLSPWDVLDGGGLSLGTITLRHPVVELDVVDTSSVLTTELPEEDTSIVRLPQIPDIDSLLDVLAVKALPKEISPLTIDAVEILDVHTTNRQRNDTASMEGVVNGFDLVVRNIDVGSNDRRGHLLNDITISLDTWKRTYSDGKIVDVEGGLVRINGADTSMSVASAHVVTATRDIITATGVLFSFAQRRLTIDSCHIGTQLTDKEWIAKQKRSGDRFRISASQLALSDIDLNALIAGTMLDVGSVTVGMLNVDVLSEAFGIPGQNNPKPFLMPHQIFAQIPFVLNIDTIDVSNASVLYSEHRHNGPGIGRLNWNKVHASVTGLSTRADVQSGSPLTVKAQGIFMDQAEMAATMTVPLNVKVYTMFAEGWMKQFDCTRLNSFLPVIEGIKVNSGRSDFASFKFSVKGRACRGYVDPVYRDLAIEIVDKKTKKGNFLTGLVSWAVNWVVVDNDNPRGEDHKVGQISYTLPKNAAIMQTLWFPIRAGLGEVAGF